MKKIAAQQSTLLDLLQSVNAHTATESEALEEVIALVNSGRVELSGNFKGERFNRAEVLAAA